MIVLFSHLASKPAGDLVLDLQMDWNFWIFSGLCLKDNINMSWRGCNRASALSEEGYYYIFFHTTPLKA